jgi:hypothetical protein
MSSSYNVIYPTEGKAKKRHLPQPEYRGREHKNQCRDIAYTFSYTIDVDYVTLETKSIVAR